MHRRLARKKQIKACRGVDVLLYYKFESVYLYIITRDQRESCVSVVNDKWQQVVEIEEEDDLKGAKDERKQSKLMATPIPPKLIKPQVT